MKEEIEDFSSQVAEDLKWFLFGDECETIPAKINSCGFEHDFVFKDWIDDDNSFIINSKSFGKYRITITKEK